MDLQRVSAGMPSLPAPVATSSTTGSAPAPAAPAEPVQTPRPEARDAFLRAAETLRNEVGAALPEFTSRRFEVGKHGMVRVQIVDQNTGAVIHQIPAEALARFAESWDAYIGTLLDHHT